MTGSRIQLGSLVIVMCVWAANLELGQILPHLDCQARSLWSIAASAVALSVALLVTTISTQIGRSMRGESNRVPSLMIALGALPFIFAILMQGAASMLVNPCQS
ncbi:hypothetical protein CPY51_27340 [Rhizobium tubonense]|uniref:Uncharacterized protein n=1 Tax=Rhizobium tubonense TaxID=484088 RepID=A0A2W4CU49_9HYPH|nr:hypothetical protein CPY51_27340 [Rhizobium tubonense]